MLQQALLRIYYAFTEIASWFEETATVSLVVEGKSSAEGHIRLLGTDPPIRCRGQAATSIHHEAKQRNYEQMYSSQREAQRNCGHYGMIHDRIAAITAHGQSSNAHSNTQPVSQRNPVLFKERQYTASIYKDFPCGSFPSCV